MQYNPKSQWPVAGPPAAPVPPTLLGGSASSNVRARIDPSSQATRDMAVWTDMQNSLDEFELNGTAARSLGGVFGAGHARALVQLRDAQIGLATAWAGGREAEVEEERLLLKDAEKQRGLAKQKAEGGRSKGAAGGEKPESKLPRREGFPAGEPLILPAVAARLGKDADDKRPCTGRADEHAKGAAGAGSAGLGRSEGIAGAGAATAGVSPDANGKEDAEKEKMRLQIETELDLELSRKRRIANDRYFEKVNHGVLDVVNQLEEVAKAMKGVESETKELWRDGADSVDAASAHTSESLS